MQVEALLLDVTIEQACLDRLKEAMESYLDSDAFQEMLQKTFQDKKDEPAPSLIFSVSIPQSLNPLIREGKHQLQWRQ